MRTFEADLHRREKQITELILKNERFDRGFGLNKYLSADDSGVLSNIVAAPSSSTDCIDFNKSGPHCFASSSGVSPTLPIAQNPTSNIDVLLNQFQAHQAEMVKRENELQQYLSNKEEKLRDKKRNSAIEASLE